MKKLLYLTIAFSLFSCTKFGKNVTIKGRAYNPATGEGIAGVTFSLQKGTLGWNGGYKTIKTATSDENGNFEVSALSLSAEQIMGDPAGLYAIGWVDPETGKQIGGNYTMQIKKGKTLHADFQAVPYGVLRMHIQNQNCQGTTDTLNIFFDGSDVLKLTGNQDANNHVGNILIEPITGCWNNTDNGFKTQMGNRYYHWTVTRSGISKTFYDTVFVKPNQTTTLNVFY